MLTNQLKTIDPSAKEPLFRRIMGDDRLAYLREDKSIIGFELDISVEQVLTGFTLIAMQKHTIYVFRSDLDEPVRLVLFPSLDKLFDEEFQLLSLNVIKTVFTDASFNGKVIKKGVFHDLVRDLTPPEKDVDIPEGVSDQMVQMMIDIRAGKQDEPQTSPPVVDIKKPVEQSVEQSVDKGEAFHDGATPFDTPSPMDDGLNVMDDGMNQFDDGMNQFDDVAEFDDGMNQFDDDSFDAPSPDFDAAVPDDVRVEDPRTVQLREQTFDTFMDVSDYAVLRLNVPKAIATQVANGALQASPDPETRLNVSIELFAKIFNDNRI